MVRSLAAWPGDPPPFAESGELGATAATSPTGAAALNCSETAAAVVVVVVWTAVAGVQIFAGDRGVRRAGLGTVADEVRLRLMALKLEVLGSDAAAERRGVPVGAGSSTLLGWGVSAGSRERADTPAGRRAPCGARLEGGATSGSGSGSG